MICEQQWQEEQRNSYLTVRELEAAERYWLYVSQCDHFLELFKGQAITKSSCLLHLNPFSDSHSVLRREQITKTAGPSQHHAILYGKHPVVKLLILSEPTPCWSTIFDFYAQSTFPYHRTQEVNSLKLYHLSKELSKTLATETSYWKSDGPLYGKLTIV